MPFSHRSHSRRGWMIFFFFWSSSLKFLKVFFKFFLLLLRASQITPWRLPSCSFSLFWMLSTPFIPWSILVWDFFWFLLDCTILFRDFFLLAIIFLDISQCCPTFNGKIQFVDILDHEVVRSFWSLPVDSRRTPLKIEASRPIKGLELVIISGLAKKGLQHGSSDVHS